MANSLNVASPSRLFLEAETAADLMVPIGVSIHGTATVEEALALFIDKGISAVPVIDEAGHPIGVVSRADILVHDREKAPGGAHGAESVQRSDPGAPRSVLPAPRSADRTQVRDIMTPAVFSVKPSTPAARVVEE